MGKAGIRLGTLTLMALVRAVPAWADIEIKVDDAMIVPMPAGEVQSTVVAPGLKKECPNGRFLVSNDFVVRDSPPANPTKGMVRGRDLDNPDGPIIESEFEAVPAAEFRRLGQDHDLVALSNGDVLLVDATMSRVPIYPKPQWFDVAFRDLQNGTFFGPGARTVVLTWR